MQFWERIELLLVLGYIALYCLAGLHGLWEGYFAKGLRNLPGLLSGEGVSWPLFVVALVAFPLAVAGMILYSAGPQSPTLSHAWKPVVLLLLGLLPVEMAKHYRDTVREVEVEPEAGRLSGVGVWVATLAALFEVPCLWMNLRLAFPG